MEEEERQDMWQDRGRKAYEVCTIHGNTFVTSLEASQACLYEMRHVFAENDGLVQERLWFLAGWMSGWVTVHPAFEI